MRIRRMRVGSTPGLRRAVFRAPILLYRWRLGWLLGSRMLLLTHTGRTSGLPRQVVLEVTGRDPRTGAYHLASGFGPGAQWYRNIQHTPQVTIQVGRRRMAAVAQPLGPEESGRLMAAYALRHPHLARGLMRMCALKTDGSREDYHRVGRDHIPFVRVLPEERSGGR
ncbi:nitroreductase family deazaflavin-dependent oxidoreductase [Streptomyces sp. NA02950]|uniref:nitroreductase family deazaflavin-dependent oxidoreductase n=1 Tax=Streptomyces sp. NA02950 TaxID=2742137 RepID=UPI001590C3A6|nr:nitroreductase family deazaflavin-dependent oxidoreductase [Streptomyces sp. NA02950]QKV96085.1 nitroreductase family deazaflavin-dependent oxidoreductase [Streptomyces sp. NA02950]